MKFAVGTTSSRKIKVLKRVLKELVEGKTFEIVSFDAKSQVSTTPLDNETIKGAKNRALDVQQHIKDADYFIGLESGLIKRYGVLYEEAWCFIVGKNNEEYCSYSSGLRVPDEIIERMKKDDKKHWQVMLDLNEERGESDEGDTWGTYSGKSLVRDISLEEALRNTLIQIFKSEKSLY